MYIKIWEYSLVFTFFFHMFYFIIGLECVLSVHHVSSENPIIVWISVTKKRYFMKDPHIIPPFTQNKTDWIAIQIAIWIQKFYPM